MFSVAPVAPRLWWHDIYIYIYIYITNMFCLGIYLGLLGYIDMNNSKQSQYNIDIIQIRFLPFCPLSVKPKRSAVSLNYS